MSKSVNPRKIDANQLQVLFGKFQQIGIRVSQEVQSELLTQLNQSQKAVLNAHHTENPLLGLIRTLSNAEWEAFLKSNTWMHEVVSRVINAVLVQQTKHLYKFGIDSKTPTIRSRKLDEVSLVARRFLLWVAGQGEDEAVTSPRTSDFTGWFPRADTTVGNRSYDAIDKDSWLKFQDKLVNLLSHKYLFYKDRDERDARLGLGSDDEEYEDSTLDLEEPDGTTPNKPSKKKKGKDRSLHGYHRDREAPVNPTGYKQFEHESVCTSILSAHSYNEAIGLALLNQICCGIDAGSTEIDENPGFYLVAALSIEFGIPPPDVLHLGLEPGVSSFGCITSRMLFLNLGSSFYRSGARAFDRDRIVLPLSREVWMLFKKALKKPSEGYVKNINIKRRQKHFKSNRMPNQKSSNRDETCHAKVLERGLKSLKGDSLLVTSLNSPKTIGDLVGLQPKAFREQWRKFVRKRMPGFATYSSHLHQVWESVALLDANIPRPLAGILRTKPLRGTHAECSYLSIPHNELVAASISIRNALREKAGLAPMKLAQAPKERYNFHSRRGTRGPTLEEYWGKTEQVVDAAYEFNEVVACIVRFMRGLGIRYSMIHFQPAYYAVSLPEPSFEILDKPVNGSDRARYLPITAPICELVKACADRFGESTDLLYLEGSQLVPFKKIRDKTAIELILDEGSTARQAGRTAFFSALLRQGCGEAIRNFLMGHGSSIFQPYSEHGMLSVSEWIRQAREPVETIYQNCRVNEIAIKLAAKVRGLSMPDSCRRDSYEPPSLPRHGVSYYGSNLDAGSISPPLPVEHALLKQIRSKLGSCKIEATPQALSCQLAFVHGIPAATLIRMAPYIRFKDFISFGGWIYLLMPMEHEDKGGLSRYPIKICEIGAPTPTLQILDRLWCRLKKINPRVHDTHLMERAVLIKTPVPPTSGYNKRRATTGNIAATHYCYHAPSPLTNASLAASLRRLLAERKVRTSLSTEYLSNLAARLSEIVCAWQHPAIVFGALRAHSKRGLNYYSPQDIFRFMDERAEAPSVYVSKSPLSAEKEIPRLTANVLDDCKAKLKQMPRGLNRQEKVTAVAKILSEMDIHPDYRVLKGLLKNSAIKLHPDEIFDELLSQGLARESSPLPLLLREALKRIIRSASVSIRGSKLRSLSWNVRQSRQLALRLYLYILADAGLRLTEPTALKKESSLLVYQRPFIFISRGKTQNSRRIVTLPQGSLTGMLRGVIRLAAKIALRCKGTERLLFLSKNPKSDGKVINRALGIASDGLISTHDLRHHVAVFSVQSIINNQLCQGNYHTAMTTLARRLGHGSMSVTEYSYLGTAVSALTLPPHSKAPLGQLLDSLTDAKMQCVHGKLRPDQFVSLVSQVASGNLAVQQKELRKLRKIENQIKSLRRSSNSNCTICFLPLAKYKKGSEPVDQLGNVTLKVLVKNSKELLPRVAEIIEMASRRYINFNVYSDEDSAKYLQSRLAVSNIDTGAILKISLGDEGAKSAENRESNQVITSIK